MPLVNDQEALIPGGERPSKFGIPVHVSLRLIVIVTFFFLPYLNQIVQYLVFAFVLISQFWITEQVVGMQLIGLRWFIDFGSMKFSYFSKPDPFVPNARDSNMFWMIFIVNIFGWIVGLFVEIFIKDWHKVVLCLLSIFTEGLNLVMFVRAHGIAKAEAEKNVLSALNQEPVPEFGMAKSDEGSISDEAEEDTSSDHVVKEETKITIPENHHEEEEEKPFDPELPKENEQ